MPDLVATIGADLTQMQTALNQSTRALKQFGADAGNAATQAGQALEKANQSALSASMRMQQMRSGLSAARDGMLAFAVGGQRADMMLMAMGHHINTLYESTGSIGGAFKSLGSSLWGPGGVILGLTVAFEAYQHFAKAEKETYEVNEHFKTSAEALHSVINNLDGGFHKAVQNLDELKINLGLAKDGMISKNEVVKEYNDTMGKTVGKVKTLAEVEDRLIKDGPDYIKMMMLKAAATTALKEAADKAVEAAKIQAQPDEVAIPYLYSGLKNSTDTNVLKDYKKIAQKSRDEASSEYKKDQTMLEKIGADFQAQAAGIAAKHHWNFLDNTGEKKTPNTLIQQLEKQLQELQDEENKWIEAGHHQDFYNLTDRERNINAIIEKIEKLKEADKGVAMPTIKGLGKESIHEDTKMTLLPSADDFEKAKKGLADYNEMQTQAYLEEQNLNRETKTSNLVFKELTRTIGTGLAGAFESAMNGTETFVSAMGHFITQLIEKLLAAAAAAALLAVLLNATGIGALLNISSGASSFGGLFGAISGFSGLMGGGSGSNIPKYANGGITTRGHLAMVGEGKEKEAIMPLSKLKNFVNTNGGGGSMELRTRISGSDLLIWTENANKQKRRIGG
jgi:hypothetical protein